MLLRPGRSRAPRLCGEWRQWRPGCGSEVLLAVWDSANAIYQTWRDGLYMFIELPLKKGDLGDASLLGLQGLTTLLSM
jgi:hypothetical protein